MLRLMPDNRFSPSSLSDPDRTGEELLAIE